jgi:hypothetical protein
MQLRPAGYQWLKEHFKLPHQLTHSSYLGTKDALEMTAQGNLEQVYGPKYTPAEDTPLAHIEFGLKYDDLNLDLLYYVFSNLDPRAIEAYIERTPKGRYARTIGFLYEWLTGKQLIQSATVTANYIDLLDPDKNYTGQAVKNPRWKINDNSLGISTYCPIVRRKKELDRLLQVDVTTMLKQLQEQYHDDVFRRAAQFLYGKETRSSFAIEKEKPSPDRAEKFIALLKQAGTRSTENVLRKDELTALQNTIVDPRYAAKGPRDFQNYVGESMMGRERFHYICPPPDLVSSLMNGLMLVAANTAGLPAQIRAAIVSFGFVFIHPFEDGNGRLHRFLIHQVVARDGLVPQGVIIPVSAHMLRNMQDYDRTLEKYSEPLMQRIRYTKKDNEELVITNPEEVLGYFRYPDLTDQVVYLADTISETMKEDLPEELEFLVRYDEARSAIQEIVDMPDKKLESMLEFLHQNGGIFPKRRREAFAELTDEEISRMQQAYGKVYELDKQS